MGHRATLTNNSSAAQDRNITNRNKYFLMCTIRKHMKKARRKVGIYLLGIHWLPEKAARPQFGWLRNSSLSVVYSGKMAISAFQIFWG